LVGVQLSFPNEAMLLPDLKPALRKSATLSRQVCFLATFIARTLRVGGLVINGLDGVSIQLPGAIQNFKDLSQYRSRILKAFGVQEIYRCMVICW
jgi:hypothetical protein